jgi:acyl-coenzyme A synthetase/AMP-(fatty) acid ligase
MVVLAEGAETSEQELREHCSGSLSGFKVPKQIDFVTRLPRSPSGKLLRAELVQEAGR